MPWDALVQVLNVERAVQLMENPVDMTSQEILELRDLATQAGQTYGCPSAWLIAIVLVESSGKRYQVRYEPSYRYVFQVEAFALKLGIPPETELITQKMSWGLGQIMGALAREQMHQGYMAELLDPLVNLKHVCTRLIALKKISPVPNDIFAMYNGGPGVLKKMKDGIYPNQSYVNKINKSLKNLRF